MRVPWPEIVTIAATYAHRESAEFGVPPTLRRLHYLIVSDPEARRLGYLNTEGHYRRLSDRTARARDAGTFPSLTDSTRTVAHPFAFGDTSASLSWLADRYRIDRAAMLPVSVIVLAEKAGLVPLLRSRFAWLPVSSVRGYSSLSHADALAGLIDVERETVALYVGDLDPTGLDIDRALSARLPYPLRRVALTPDQVERYALPSVPAKAGDSRSGRMVASHGAAVQVEVDALPSSVLLDTVAAEITEASGVTIRANGLPDLPDADSSEIAAQQYLANLAGGAA